MPESMLSQFNSSLSSVLSVLQSGEADQFPKRKSIDTLIKEAEVSEDTLFSILSFLAILGFIEIGDDNDVVISSKYPNLAISAIKARVDLALSVSHNLRDTEKKRFFRDFTKNLEFVRKELNGEEKPIHTREMVNIIIRGKKIKNWKFRDVFLHILHPDWHEYHLIGLGKRGESSTDALVHKAINLRLGLEQTNYDIDPNIKPPVIEFLAISKSQGALTQYRIHTRVVKKLKLDLNKHLKALIKDNAKYSLDSFKWFSMEEINQRIVNGMSVMESTARVLNNIDHSIIPVLVSKAKNLNNKPIINVEMQSDIPNRIDIVKAGSYLLGILLVLWIFNSGKIFNYLDVGNQLFDVTEKSFSIVGNILTILLALKGIRDST